MNGVHSRDVSAHYGPSANLVRISIVSCNYFITNSLDVYRRRIKLEMKKIIPLARLTFSLFLAERSQKLQQFQWAKVNGGGCVASEFNQSA
jgi:hypothetical protein